MIRHSLSLLLSIRDQSVGLLSLNAILLYYQGAAEVDRVNGVNAAELTKKVRQHAGAATSGSSSSPAEQTSVSVR